MEKTLHDNYCKILRTELVPALGCTEPIAIAFAAARAGEELGAFPTHMEVCCSGNMIKNVKGVFVPHAGRRKGIDVAAVLGLLVGHSEHKLEVLESVRPEHLARADELLAGDFCRCSLKEGVANLYLLVKLTDGKDSVSVEVQDYHTHITRIEKNGRPVFTAAAAGQGENDCSAEKKTLSIAGIIEFAEKEDLADVREVLEQQIRLNTAIAAEGLKNDYGAHVGKTLLRAYGESVAVRARAAAAAGSDARMNGCALPVVINSGSGNQGITVTLPVLTYAQELQVSHETTLRALAMANLLAIHQKAHIGSLSAFCGAVCAAVGSGAAITYLKGGTPEQIENTVINALSSVCGMVCDGAKSSCAAKISLAVDAALTAGEMSLAGERYSSGDGLVKDDGEATIDSVCRMARVGMHATDVEILNIMLEK